MHSVYSVCIEKSTGQNKTVSELRRGSRAEIRSFVILTSEFTVHRTTSLIFFKEGGKTPFT